MEEVRIASSTSSSASTSRETDSDDENDPLYPSEVEEWTSAHCLHFLLEDVFPRAKGTEQVQKYATAMRELDIDGTMLASMSESDLINSLEMNYRDAGRFLRHLHDFAVEHDARLADEKRKKGCPVEIGYLFVVLVFLIFGIRYIVLDHTVAKYY
mmetsp:Transcript_15956/g.40366  ORF Transcript_15956/g.40366 Transcript_15956/m.40366 type:complete len:155 (-) Transcript_15956:13-477(-)|eukprot:CAMPEP_0113894378 /NCGR_PEP_ID=MMETSP0780_2-20120614/16683_1 /TAXON_ID=652834 /ORGANISM="Palpitomonas bilix" /LENGTH=154 /DNA_ID=CAMNT_0000884909 /DNA_START=122 /DNA_END=586 /DNA_ORIENTATION=- /assembly_acc=CAM_ASM_000599